MHRPGSTEQEVPSEGTGAGLRLPGLGGRGRDYGPGPLGPLRDRVLYQDRDWPRRLRPSRQRRKESSPTKPLEELLAAQDQSTVQTLADYIQDHVHEQWRQVLEENQEELRRLFDEAGEAAYREFSRKLFQPVQEQLERAGFLSEPRFPGALSASKEWGPIEERRRWLWSVVRREGGAPLGTLVVGLFHDHTRFRIPRSPGVLGLKETDADGIVRVIVRAAGDRQSGQL